MPRVRSSCLLTRINLLRNPLSASCIICCEYYASGACLCIAGLMCRTFGQCIPSSAVPCTTCCGGAAAGECLCMPCHFCLPIITDCTKAAHVLQMMCGACRYVLCTFALLPACCLTKRNAALAPCRRRAASAQVRAPLPPGVHRPLAAVQYRLQPPACLPMLQQGAGMMQAAAGSRPAVQASERRHGLPDGSGDP